MSDVAEKGLKHQVAKLRGLLREARSRMDERHEPIGMGTKYEHDYNDLLDRIDEALRLSVELVICETTAAITNHFRIVTPEAPIRLSGHYPRPKTLCNVDAAWDTQIPVENGARCRTCREKAAELGWDERRR